MKHTQGEWQVGDYLNDNKERFLAVWNENILNGQRGNPICLVAPKAAEDETDYANAKLIAAAPELLEALQMAVNIIRHEMVPVEWHNDPKAINDCLATMNETIAKATGNEIKETA